MPAYRYAPGLRTSESVKIFQNLLPKKLQDLNDLYVQQSGLNANENSMRSDEHQSRAKQGKSRSAVYLTPYQVRKHLQRLFKNEPLLCTLIYGYDAILAKELSLENIHSEQDMQRLFSLQPRSPVSCDIFYLHALPVPPNRFRPPSVMDSQVFENPTNTHLTSVLKRCGRIRDLMARAASDDKGDDNGNDGQEATIEQHRMELFDKEWHTLQLDVIGLVDNTKAVRARGRTGSVTLPAGVRQVLERKEGLLRKHLMVGAFIHTCIAWSRSNILFSNKRHRLRRANA